MLIISLVLKLIVTKVAGEKPTYKVSQIILNHLTYNGLSDHFFLSQILDNNL